MLLLLIAAFPETHHYYARQQLRKSDAAAADAIARRAHVPEPVFQKPWAPLKYFLEPSVGGQGLWLLLLLPAAAAARCCSCSWPALRCLAP